MKKLLLLAALFLFTANLNKSFATHIPGANITYTCDPANPLTYTFTLTLFRVCPGTHPATMSSTYFTLTNDCGLVNPIVPTFNQVGVEQDVNQLCSSAVSDCSGGTDPGLLMYTYEATITLPADCDSWTIAFDLCCRDQSTNMTGGTGNNMYTQTTMNTMTSPCNDSPTVTANPIPYACVNTPFNYCLTTTDPQGDSTVYSMIDPMGAGGVPIVFEPGYSANAPLQNFTLDPLTGCMTFTSPITGNFVVNVQIDSYDSNGDLVCSIVHDFQVIVMSCTNSPPNNPAVGITNFSGTGTQLGPNDVGLCYGDNICFDVVFSDPADPTDNITITTDGTTLLPGATFTQTGTNPATGTFCWTAQPGFTGSIVTFVAEDDGCPVMGTSGFAVDFAIATGVYAGPDPYICGSQTATLQANGATNYTWSPGTGLSCTNCANPVASPAVTTTYTLTGNLGGTCPNTDQVTVNVVPDYPLTVTPNPASICANEVVQLNATGPGAQGPYTVSWNPSYALSDPNIANPLAQPIVSTTYTATVTSAAGCTKTADAVINISGIGPTVTIDPPTADICAGESVPLTATANIYPLMCGPSAGCTGTNSNIDIGSATTATTSYTPFYGSTVNTTNYTNKVQYIYTAAELNAMGVYGGTIERIALYCTSSYSYDYDGVDIWIGCTSQDQFTSTSFTPTGTMTQVYGTTNNVNPTNNGWTYFDINDWDWDGTSNLIIQICADETNVSGSESFRYSTTSPAYRCMYYHTSSTLTDACTYATGSRVTNRPNMRFDMCVQTVPGGATYAWSPGTGLSSTSSPNPTASPTTTTSYVLDVTANGCTGSGIAQINVSPDYTLNPTASPLTLCYGNSTILDAQPSGGGLTYSWEPAGAFTNPTAANPTVTPTGPTTYYVQTSNGFCNKLDSIYVDVAGLPASVIASEDTVCQGTPVNLNLVPAAATCGIDYSDCSGTVTQAVSGTATTATTTYGPFYGSSIAYTNKKQYIFTADELTTMGFTAGMITELAFDVSTNYGRSYDDLTIWIGCTSMDQFPNTSFVSTATMDQVYYNPYYTTSTGWNTFNITGYNWDGSSNIIIQICAKQTVTLGGSESTRYSTTAPFYRCLYYNTSALTACSQATGSRVTNRPNIRFGMCNNSFGAGATYSWAPSFSLNDATIENPIATPYSTTTYQVTVSDPANPACNSTASVDVVIDPSNSVVASPDTMICPGDAAPLNAVFTGPVPTVIPCGLNSTGYSGANTQSIVGTGTASTSTYGPFYGSYSDVKYQFLYHASDLQAAGFTSGTITELAINVITNYTTGPFQDFTIRMGCTNENNLVVANGWLPTQGPVWGPTDYNAVVGWNNFVLTTPFDWDGTSNIVIETCFNNSAAISYCNHQYSNSPGFTTTMRNYQNLTGGGANADGCNLTPSFVYQYRPNLRLRVYDPPAGVATYSWSPATDLSSTTIPDPIATPSVDQSYVITVTGGICTVYDTVNVTICNPLPVELIDFSGYNLGEVNQIEWKTVTETNNDYFILQRSEDGELFEDLGTIDAVGTSMTENNYRFIDEQPIMGVNYYRLKQVDTDGTYTFSDVIAINADRGSNVQIYPNPTTNDLFIDFGEDLEEGVHTILITDISGKTVSQQIEYTQLQKTYKITGFNQMTPGIYIVKVIDASNEMIKYEKITKQ